MILNDRYGNALRTRSAEARDAYVDGVDRVLAADHGARAAFEAALAADPGFALAEAGRARAAMYEGDMAAAREAIGRAETLAAEGDARERAHVAVFAALLGGRAAEARALVRAHVAEHPRDALVAQVCTNIFGLIGFSGAPGREADLHAYTAALLPAYGEDWWMMSMHALSLCEVGRTEEALALMERALALNPRNANGAHFKAHVLYEEGEVAAGLAYLDGWLAGYDRRSLLHGHLSWHVALWALAEGDAARMWAMLDGAIAPGASESLPINVLTDTAALLYRAEIAGLEVDPARWRALSDYAAAQFADPGQSFADIHAALCHAMAGEGERLARLAEAEAGFAADLVRPVAAAFGAIARGDWSAALERLVPVMADHPRLGGSRAQRDLLEFTYLQVLLRLGRGEEARRTLALRRPALAAGAPVAGLH